MADKIQKEENDKLYIELKKYSVIFQLYYYHRHNYFNPFIDDKNSNDNKKNKKQSLIKKF